MAPQVLSMFVLYLVASTAGALRAPRPPLMSRARAPTMAAFDPNEFLNTAQQAAQASSLAAQQAAAEAQAAADAAAPALKSAADAAQQAADVATPILKSTADTIIAKSPEVTAAATAAGKGVADFVTAPPTPLEVAGGFASGLFQVTKTGFELAAPAVQEGVCVPCGRSNLLHPFLHTLKTRLRSPHWQPPGCPHRTGGRAAGHASGARGCAPSCANRGGGRQVQLQDAARRGKQSGGGRREAAQRCQHADVYVAARYLRCGAPGHLRCRDP